MPVPLVMANHDHRSINGMHCSSPPPVAGAPGPGPRAVPPAPLLLYGGVAGGGPHLG